jgi:hypothetical protein
MKTVILATSIAALLVGCATAKPWSATGGSRADATVRLSYEYGPFEKPQTNESEAVNLAIARCKTWGYTGAEAFGGSTQQCSMPGGMGGCNRWTVTKEYQCTGTGTPGQTGN